MGKTSSVKWVRKSAAEVRKASDPARLRRASKRPVDTSDIPEVRLTGSGESHRLRKRSVTLRLDQDVVEFFRSQGTGYQTRINRVLRESIKSRQSVRDELKRAANLIERLADRVKQ